MTTPKKRPTVATGALFALLALLAHLCEPASIEFIRGALVAVGLADHAEAAVKILGALGVVVAFLATPHRAPAAPVDGE